MKPLYDNHGTYLKEISNEPGKVNLATIITTGIIITTFTFGGLLIKNYLCEKVIPEAYSTKLMNPEKK